MPELPKRIHIVGICGVATSALAIAFHNKGVKVTGSDKGFFPPVSTELEKHAIEFYAGWHPEKMVENGAPDLVIVTSASGSQNPETLYAREHGLKFASYTEVFRDYFIQENSIVCAGTWGKTSSTALLSYIFERAGMDPGYMFGGISLSHGSSAKIGDSQWSIFEGDEYKSGPTDPKPKFSYYKPTHLLLTAVSWDHADLYPTEESYFNAFRTLLRSIPENGLVVACGDRGGVMKILPEYKGKKVLYGRDGGDSAYAYGKVSQSGSGIDFTITHSCKEYKVRSPMLGAFQAENITGCFAMAHEAGIAPEKIISAIASFKGLKRRLEKRLEGSVTIIDDIAHSPEKAASVLSTLRQIYSGKIMAVFEPNIGGRSRESAAKYDNAFKDADSVIIPRLTKLKVAEDEKDMPMEGDDLTQTISKTQPDVKYIEDDQKLIEYVVSSAQKGDVIAFLGSHGFRGMIEGTITKLT